MPRALEATQFTFILVGTALIFMGAVVLVGHVFAWLLISVWNWPIWLMASAACIIFVTVYFIVYTRLG